MVITRHGKNTCRCEPYKVNTHKKKYILNKHVKQGGDDAKYECVMCFGNMSIKSDLVRCPGCTNIFHWKCWSVWYRSSDKTTCPVCRNIFDECMSEQWDFHKDMLLK